MNNFLKLESELTLYSTNQRIALGLEYDGTNYHGWQIQTPNLVTIQDTVESALSKVANQAIEVSCAGRTDVGVHALEQVIHFDTKQIRPLTAWIHGTNRYLPKDIRVQWAKNVSDNFHARFSATSRYYRYLIYNHPYESALWNKKALWFPWKLDVNAMQQACRFLLGEHDFSSFRASSCQSNTTQRFVYLATVKREGDFVVIDIKANAFLHHMVRNIVGTLLVIGQNKQLPEWMQYLLQIKDRKQSGATALACGLYFMSVDYPEL